MTSVQPLTLNYIFTVRRYLVLAVAVVVAAVAVTALITLPQIANSFQANTERVAANQKLEKLRTKVSQLELANNPQFLAQSELVNALLPSKKPLVETLSGINAAQVASQVSIVSIELSPGQVATASALLTPDVNVTGPSDSMPLFLTVEGTLQQLNLFFESVEKTTPLITITELTLSPLEGDGLLGGNVETVSTQPYSAKLILDAAFYVQNIDTAAESELPQISGDEQRIVDELDAFTTVAPDIQTQVVGGGLQDLFGLVAPQLVLQGQAQPVASPETQIPQN